MSPDAPFLVVVLVVMLGVAVCLMVAAIMVPDMLGVGAWPVLAGAVVALVCALSALWVIQTKRDRTLR